MSAPSELERVRDYLRLEPVYRVELNRGYGQVGRISYVEAVDEADARGLSTSLPPGVRIVSVRRATCADTEEAIALD